MSTPDMGVHTFKFPVDNPLTSHRPLSEIFDDILESHPGESITTRAIIDHLGQRAYGPLLMLFAAPNAVPNFPGSGLLSAPLFPLAFQMARGNPPWVPRRLAEKSINRQSLERLRDRAKPWLRRVDRAVRPRWKWLTTPFVERCLGAYITFIALVLLLPIPLANMFPSWAVVAMGVGVLERDGVWIAAGILWGFVALAIAATVVWTAAALAMGALSLL